MTLFYGHHMLGHLIGVTGELTVLAVAPGRHCVLPTKDLIEAGLPQAEEIVARDLSRVLALSDFYGLDRAALKRIFENALSVYDLIAKDSPNEL